MSKPRVKLPKKAAVGEIITIKTLVNHKMESGQRKDKQGNRIPRMIINSFKCNFNGNPVFSCDIEPAVSANPFMEFAARVQESGEFELIWEDDEGSVISTKKKITVS